MCPNSSNLARWLALVQAVGTLWAQSAGPPASVSGTVTNSVTGEPILRAHVTVSCIPGDPPREQRTFGALTNATGEFTVMPLPPGNCSVNAQRVGFVASSNGADYPLAAGTHQEGVKLTLTPTGAVTGQVFDSAGGPAQGVNVSGEGPGGNSANATTDDRGQFRLGGLRPGKYRVKATPQSMPFPPEIRSDGSRELHDAAAYYPDSLSAKSAQRVEVRAGGEVSAIDIRLVRTPIVKVSGQVAGLPPDTKNAVLTVFPASQGAGVKADGTFATWRLDPGKYTLQAAIFSGQTRLMSAPLDIEVSTTDLEHLELRMVPPFEIAGHVRFDDEQARQAPQPPSRPGQPAPQLQPQPHRLELVPLTQFNSEIARGPVAADDSFTLEKVQPGRYKVAITWGTGYVKSVRAGDTESEGDVLDVRNGAVGPLTVTIGSNFCEVTGTVSDSKGPVVDAPVLVVPTEDPWNYRVARTDSSGAYKFRLAPGKYKLIPADEDSMAWGRRPGQNWEEYDEVAESLDLSAGDKVTKDLRQRK